MILLTWVTLRVEPATEYLKMFIGMFWFTFYSGSDNLTVLIQCTYKHLALKTLTWNPWCSIHVEINYSHNNTESANGDCFPWKPESGFILKFKVQLLKPIQTMARTFKQRQNIRRFIYITQLTSVSMHQVWSSASAWVRFWVHWR